MTLRKLRVLLVLGAAACGLQTSTPAARAPTGSKAPASAPSASAEAMSCQVTGPGEPLAMDTHVAALGFSPAELARTLEGTHTFAVHLEPWWSARALPSTMDPLSVAITATGTARAMADDEIALDVQVVLSDVQGALAEPITMVLQANKLRTVYGNASFRAPALAARVGAPKPVDAALLADELDLQLSFDGSAWSGALSALRNGNACALITFPPPVKTPCSAFDGLLTMDPSAVTERRDAKDPIAPRLVPRDLVRAIERLGPLEIAFKGRPATPLELRVTLGEFTCVTRGDVPFRRDAYEVITEPGMKVVAPASFMLSTADQRVHAQLDGLLEAYVSDAHGWDGHVHAASAMSLAKRYVAAGETVGFDVPPDTLSFLTLSLHAPLGLDIQDQLALQVYRPYEGVPEYPEVIEFASNRAHCFGVWSEHEQREAPIARR